MLEINRGAPTSPFLRQALALAVTGTAVVFLHVCVRGRRDVVVVHARPHAIVGGGRDKAHETLGDAVLPLRDPATRSLLRRFTFRLLDAEPECLRVLASEVPRVRLRCGQQSVEDLAQEHLLWIYRRGRTLPRLHP